MKFGFWGRPQHILFLCFSVVFIAVGIGCGDSGGASGSQSTGGDTTTGADTAPGNIHNSGADSANNSNGQDTASQTTGNGDTTMAGDTGVAAADNEPTRNGDDAGGATGDTAVVISPDGGGSDPDSFVPVDIAQVEESPLVNWCKNSDDKFSFFVTSMIALWTLAGDNISNLNGGFGGDFGGIAGADAICQAIGAAVGHGNKTWRAFLSATDDGQGNPVHAIERIGTGPWYDANGRLVASGIAGLQATRPDGDALSTDDLPDECGIPLSIIGDSHDIPTGSNALGKLSSTNKDSTCNDWTSSSGTVGSTGGGKAGGTVMCGHSFPREVEGGGGPGGGGPGGGGKSWVSDHPLRGCGKGANLLQNGPGTGTCIGCAGGYGGLYCFAL